MLPGGQGSTEDAVPSEAMKDWLTVTGIFLGVVVGGLLALGALVVAVLVVASFHPLAGWALAAAGVVTFYAWIAPRHLRHRP
jgi:hypothetical protein